MKQLEIRLALVLYGGVSLAVYMHGVTRELLNLVRASKRFRDQSRAAAPPAGDAAAGEPATTADVYLSLFRALSATLELRVVVDIIAGASAGGINGVMLARAIAHDLSLDPHRELWLTNADVTRLADQQPGISRYLKSSMAPVFDRLLARALDTPDPETTHKLRTFVQSRWFTPPFSGRRFIGWMLDACQAMRERAPEDSTLLPRGHRLDLFVTLTDYFGHRRRIAIDDPSFIEEMEHRRILRFTCARSLSGDLDSQFADHNVPGLVFAARATSSFPGAFPPATVAELDEVLEGRGNDWSQREQFVTGHRFDEAGDPGRIDQRVFVDGSVVMNKPFGPVLATLGDRPANRQIVRRLVYVDPLPGDPGEQAVAPVPGAVPGFFRTILASLAHIPRNEPISDELQTIEAWNLRARRIGEVIASADPAVERLVAGIVRSDYENPPTVDEVLQWRTSANQAAHDDAGYAYLGYQKLKLRGVRRRVATLIVALAGAGTEQVDEVSARIAAWLDDRTAQGDTAARVVSFLRDLDVDFRVRRLRFVIRRLNELYNLPDAGGEQLSQPIDDMKATLYELIDEAAQRWERAFYDQSAAREAAALCAGDDRAPDACLKALAASMKLSATDRVHDDVIAVMALNYLAPALRFAVTNAYIGFAFYDLITLPILQRNDLSEMNEVLVDRISPRDSRWLSDEGVTLRGGALQAFGAFFNRAWREHDYLWGRLNAAERLLSVIRSAVGARHAAAIDVDALQRALFHAILDEEEEHLRADPTLIAQLRRELDRRA